MEGDTGGGARGGSGAGFLGYLTAEKPQIAMARGFFPRRAGGCRGGSETHRKKNVNI